MSLPLDIKMELTSSPADLPADLPLPDQHPPTPNNEVPIPPLTPLKPRLHLLRLMVNPQEC